MTGTNAFNVDIIDFPQTTIAVMEHRGEPTLLGHTIQKFIAWRRANGLTPNKYKTFNLLYHEPTTVAPEDYRFDLGCETKNTVNTGDYNINKQKIPAGKCALIKHVGSDDTIAVAINYLYQQWLLNSEYQLRDFPLFLQRISFFPEVAESDMVTHIYLPIC